MSRFTATLADRLGSIETTLTLQGGELDDKLGLRAREAAAVLEAHIEAFESRTAAKAEEVGQALENLAAALIKDSIHARKCSPRL